MPTWEEKLANSIEPRLAQEIDVFETEMLLRKQGKLDEKIFAETRLRRGIYGQRYDNGHRHDGIRTQALRYPSGELTKDGRWASNTAEPIRGYVLEPPRR